MYGFGWCNPAYADGTGAMTTGEYIATCPEDWRPTLEGMRHVADQMFGQDGWKITQIKTKFNEPRVSLDILQDDVSFEKRQAMSDLEAFVEVTIAAVIARLKEAEDTDAG